MATNIKPKSTEIYLTKTEVLDFFRMSNEDINYFVKNELLIPSTMDDKIKYGLRNIMGCMSLLIAWEKTAF
jgi:hypothetical protein